MEPLVDAADGGFRHCWDGGFSFLECCSQEFGAFGNPDCWTGGYSFESCCLLGWGKPPPEPEPVCDWPTLHDSALRHLRQQLSSGKRDAESELLGIRELDDFRDQCCLFPAGWKDFCWGAFPLLQQLAFRNHSKGYLSCCFGRLRTLGADVADPAWLAGELAAETAKDLSPVRRVDLDRLEKSHGMRDAAGHLLCRLVHTHAHSRRPRFSGEVRTVTVRPARWCLQNGRVRSLSVALQVLAWLGKLPPQLDMIVTTRDVEVEDYGVPVFADIRAVDLPKGSVLRFPHEFLLGYWGRLMPSRVRKAVQNFPWADKVERLFWRGGMTGRWICPPDAGAKGSTACQVLDNYHEEGRWNITHWDLSPRSRVVQLSSFVPQWVDAKFSDTNHMTEEVADLLQARGWLEEGRPKLLERQFQYKYLLVTDDSDRVYWMATGNSLLFMPASNMLRGCGLGAFKPGIHFVPLRADLSDAIEQVLWAKEHDEDARLIAAQGASLARRAFSHEAQLYCLQRMLEEYASRLVD